MTQEVLRSALEITESDELTNTNFTVFQPINKYLFSSAPDIAIQELEEIEEIEEDDEWDDDDGWEDDEWDDTEWEDEEVDWDDVDWIEDD